MQSRRIGRELCLQMLFAASFFTDDPLPAGLRVLEFSESPSDSKIFAETIFRGILNKSSEIDKVIKTHLKNWNIDRLWLVDRSILEIAIYELFYLSETPPSVAIDQAVRMAKKFGGDESGKFVNGILDKIRENSPERKDE